MPLRTLLPLILLLAFLFGRFYDLELRPPHHDEAVNGWFVDGMFRTGFYRYDPQNYHGPLYFYLLALSELVFGRSVEALRFVTVFFGGLLSLVPFLYRRWIGKSGSWIAAFALAVSPAVVFYSRYAIHEILFAFFTAIFFYFWLRAREEIFSSKVMWGLGFSLGALACLKENFVIFIGCLAIAEGMSRFYDRRMGEKRLPALSRRYGWSVAVASGLIVIFYSAFGRDPGGVGRFFEAFRLWFDTGHEGNGHQKPFDYWFKVLGTYEWATIAGVALSVLALRKKVPPALRLLSVLSVGVLLAYSIVSYKTPWCLLCFQWGFVLIFGFWTSLLWKRSKIAAILVFSLIGLHSVYRAYDVSYVHVDAEDSYYIYGQTYREFMPPIKEITDRLKANPELKEKMRIQVLSGYTWPLPFLFGEVRQVGYYSEQNAPAHFDADYVLIDEPFDAKYTGRIKGNYSRQVYRVRQWASPMVIYTRH